MRLVGLIFANGLELTKLQLGEVMLKISNENEFSHCVDFLGWYDEMTFPIQIESFLYGFWALATLKTLSRHISTNI